MTGIPDDEDLTGRLRLSVTRLARVLRGHDDDLKLTPTDSAMLATIAWEGEPTLGTLATAEHIAPPTVTKSIDSLEAAGLVERFVDPDDGRVRRVRLSAAGRRNVRAYRARVNGWLGAQLEELSNYERDELERAVEILEHLVHAGRLDEARE